MIIILTIIFCSIILLVMLHRYDVKRLENRIEFYNDLWNTRFKNIDSNKQVNESMAQLDCILIKEELKLYILKLLNHKNTECFASDLTNLTQCLRDIKEANQQLLKKCQDDSNKTKQLQGELEEVTKKIQTEIDKTEELLNK